METVIKTFRHPWMLLALLAWPARISAHPLDEYVQAILVAIEPGEIRLQMNLTPGVAVAEQVLGLIDRNHDGIISTNESTAYAELVRRDLVARLDGRDVELRLAALNFPEPSEIRTGWGIIQLEFSVRTGVLAAGPHTLALDNRHRPVASAYLLNAAQPGSAAIKITGQKRNENQSTGEITFDFQPPAKPLMTVGIVVLLGAISLVLFACVWRARKKQQV